MTNASSVRSFKQNYEPFWLNMSHRPCHSLILSFAFWERAQAPLAGGVFLGSSMTLHILGKKMRAGPLLSGAVVKAQQEG